jgi:hypothetical protein
VYAGTLAVPVSSQMGIGPLQSVFLKQPHVFFIVPEPASEVVVRHTGLVLVQSLFETQPTQVFFIVPVPASGVVTQTGVGVVQSLFETQPTHIPGVGPEAASVDITQTGVIALSFWQALGPSLSQPLQPPAVMSQKGVPPEHVMLGQVKVVPPVPWEPAAPPAPPLPPAPPVPALPPVPSMHSFVPMSQVWLSVQSLF